MEVWPEVEQTGTLEHVAWTKKREKEVQKMTNGRLQMVISERREKGLDVDG